MSWDGAECFWKRDPKPWSDQWWKLFAKFAEYVCALKKKKKTGRSDTTIHPEDAGNWAKLFYNIQGAAKNMLAGNKNFIPPCPVLVETMSQYFILAGKCRHTMSWPNPLRNIYFWLYNTIIPCPGVSHTYSCMIYTLLRHSEN